MKLNTELSPDDGTVFAPSVMLFVESMGGVSCNHRGGLSWLSLMALFIKPLTLDVVMLCATKSNNIEQEVESQKL